MFLKRGLKETLEASKKNKLMLSALFVLQIIFIVVLTYTTMIYSVKIINNIQEVIGPAQQVNYGDEQQDILNQLLPIYQSYAHLKSNLLQFAGWLAGLVLIFQGLLWTLSHKILGARKLGKIAVKYLVTALIGMGLFAFLSSVILNSITIDNLKTPLIILGVISLILYFIFLNILAFINTENWKQFIKKIRMNFKRMPHSLLTFVINITLVGLFSYLIYLARNYFLFGSLFTAILFALLVLTRIFWISCLNEKTK